MPNYCHNRLQVLGTAKEVAQFQQINSVKGDSDDGHPSIISFWGVAPVPAEVEAKGYSPSDSFNIGAILGIKPPAGTVLSGYDWRCLHWGTKWDACEGSVEKIKGGLYYSFDTAWSPPEPWFRELAKRFPNLNINMYSIEEQPSFAVHYAAAKGKVKSKDYLQNGEPSNKKMSIGQLKEMLENFGHGPINRIVRYIPSVWRDAGLRADLLEEIELEDDSLASVLVKLNLADRQELAEYLLTEAPKVLDRSLADPYAWEEKGTSPLEIFKEAPPVFRKNLGKFAIRSKERINRSFGIGILGTLETPTPGVKKPGVKGSQTKAIAKPRR